MDSRMVLNEANIVICCGDYAKMWHADPQSAKQTNVILMKKRNGQPNETKKWITQRNILRGKSERITYRISRATKNLSANGLIC